MHNACPRSEFARGEALRHGTASHLALLHAEECEIFATDNIRTHQDASLSDGYSAAGPSVRFNASRFNLRTGGVDEPPAKLPVRTHEMQIIDGNIMVIGSGQPPNLPPGLTAEGHV